MSADRDVARIVRSWLEDGATALPDRVLDNVLAELPATRQRRLSWPVRRIAQMNGSLRIALVAAAVVLAAVVGLQFLPGPKDVGGPAPTPLPTLPLDEGAVLGGTYSLGEGFPVRVSLTVPQGWMVCGGSGVEQAVCNPAPSGVDVGFLDVLNVTAESCKPDLLDPPVGPSVDDLVAAISGLDGFTATEPVDITIDG